MPSISIQDPTNGDVEIFDDPSPLYPIWFVAGVFDTAPWIPVPIGPHGRQVPSVFCTVDLRIYEDGADAAHGSRPTLHATVPMEVDMALQSFHAGNIQVRVQSPGKTIVTLVAVMDIFTVTWNNHPIKTRGPKCTLATTVCSAPVRMTLWNTYSPHP